MAAPFERFLSNQSSVALCIPATRPNHGPVTMGVDVQLLPTVGDTTRVLEGFGMPTFLAACMAVASENAERQTSIEAESNEL